MKTIFTSIVCLVLIFTSVVARSQSMEAPRAPLPVFALKTNLIYDALTTINLSAEVGLSSNTSIDLAVSYNPWKFPNQVMMKHWILQPQFRYWFKERFDDWFVGVELHYGTYNIAGSKLFKINDIRYQGLFFGGGATVGYAWPVSPRWKMEAELGLGYTHIEYDKYNYRNCGKHLEKGNTAYIGPTKIALSIIYTL